MKTILITGSTDGIGKLAAIKLAKANHQIILHGRSEKKVQESISEIKEISNNQNITGVVSDLSDFSSIQKVVLKLTSSITHLDVLINNAGVFKSTNQTNKDGYDLRFVVNYLAPYQLTYGLLPLLRKSSYPRLINLSSAAQAPVSDDALSGKKSLSQQEAYAQSKLALTMWSFAFATKNSDVLTIAVNPGSLLNTKMVQEAYGHHWSSADKGANILCDLSLSEEYTENSGQYFDNDIGKFNSAHPDAYDEVKISNLLSLTDKLLSD